MVFLQFCVTGEIGTLKKKHGFQLRISDRKIFSNHSAGYKPKDYQSNYSREVGTQRDVQGRGKVASS